MVNRIYPPELQLNKANASDTDQGLSEPEFYGDLVYKFKKIVGRADFFLSVQTKNYRTLQTYWI